MYSSVNRRQISTCVGGNLVIYTATQVSIFSFEVGPGDIQFGGPVLVFDSVNSTVVVFIYIISDQFIV